MAAFKSQQLWLMLIINIIHVYCCQRSNQVVVKVWSGDLQGSKGSPAKSANIASQSVWKPLIYMYKHTQYAVCRDVTSCELVDLLFLTILMRIEKCGITCLDGGPWHKIFSEGPDIWIGLSSTRPLIWPTASHSRATHKSQLTNLSCDGNSQTS